MKEFEGIKKCTSCQKELPLSSYYKQKRKTIQKGTFYVYKSECKDCTKANSSSWTIRNREKHRRYVEEYYTTEKGRENRQRKKGKIGERVERFREKNPEYMRLHNQKRYAKNRNLESNLKIEEWKSCLSYFNHCCAYCGTSERELNELGEILEQEHFVPVSKNGGYTKSNILPSCRSCNMYKYNHDFDEWYSNYYLYSEDRKGRIMNYLNMVKE